MWLLGDGKPGHENQSLGLADALARRVTCELHRISLAEARGFTGRISGAVKASAGFPKPDIILAAGHATHGALLWLTRKHRAKSIVLMKPSLPMSWFDLCIVPAHDFPVGYQNDRVVLTRGALNRLTSSETEKTGKLILIGGPSKTHGWDGPALIDKLAMATDRGGWELSDSRRTPAGFLDDVRAKLPGITAFPHQETPPEWVTERLRRAKEVWVTEDSVSMIYEALTSGAKVGLLPVPRIRADARILKGIDHLLENGFLTTFSEWEKSCRILAPPEILREADRCAEWVLGKL